MTSRALHALLIGVDHYLEPVAGGVLYPSLEGSVRDVRRMARYLHRDLDVPERRIHRLTASNPPTEAPGEQPTYENMVAAIRRLIETAGRGDSVIVHYSGHGGRTPTIAPEVKPNGLDETLVPTNIADPTARYLRDLELACLIGEMVGKGLRATLVLDCCHSGGTTRTSAVPRGGAAVDRTPRPGSSAVAPAPVLARNWRRLAASTPRDMHLGSGWLPDPRGYVLLAACQAQELAFEYAFDGHRKVGAFTHRLLEALRKMGTDCTYRQLHHRVGARVRSQFELQTPQLEGEADRLLFALEPAELPRHAVNVVGLDADRLILNTGQAQGIRAGARFAIFAPGRPGEDSANKRLAIAEVTGVGAVDSWARIIHRTRRIAIEAGAQAVPLDQDADGRPMDAHAAHLARFRALEELHNDDPMSPLQRKLRVALSRLPPDYSPERRPVCTPAWERPVGPSPEECPAGPSSHQAACRALEVTVGDWICLSIENLALQALNITILDLRPSLSVAQVYPPPGAGPFLPLDPGEERRLPLRADLPLGIDRGTDVLKVFATLEASDFKWLELAPIDGPATRPGGNIRSLEPAVYPSRDWVVEQVEVSVTRRT